ncbi:MAG: M42 family metallopeptidase [Ruminococcaceae bacterium]|nr:M42 family metallopeptidase [Oscillospiraceae bacterium]
MESNRYFSDIKELYKKLSAVPSVSGNERAACGAICDIVFEYTNFFDSFEETPAGGLLFFHHAKKENAKKILFDAHLDTVGFCVTQLLDGGFLKVRNVGGIDKRLLFASDVEIYGKNTVKGVFVSTPPHLSKGENKNKLPDISDIYVDTGLSFEKMCELISVGDFCSFASSYTELMGDIICGAGMDDKICAVAILIAVKMLENDKNYKDDNDIIFSFSSAEEINGSGAACISKLCADAAIVLDVNFGREKGVAEYESYKLGTGCGVSYSSTTSRELTDAVIRCAKNENIPCNTLVEAKNTGTNAHNLSNSHLGTRCCVLSVPEKYMHCANEAVDIKDVLSCGKLLCAFAGRFNSIYDEMNKGKIIKPLPEVI